jgi:erythromycin esterase-like protein
VTPFRRRRIARWAREHATPVSIRDVADAARADVEALAWLDPLLEGKRFAFVGEGNHFVHEKLGYRLFVTRYLASRGFGVLLEELAWSDGVRIDRYLESGDSSWLDRIGTFGHQGDRRADRDDSPTGYLAEGREHYPTAAFRHEHVRWLRALRDVRTPAGERLAHRGFDVDYEPGAGYAHLAEELAREEPLAARVPGESLEAEIARLERLAAKLGTRTARSLRDGFRYVALTKDAKTLDSLRPGMAFREQVMHEQVDDVVASRPPGARFIVFAHDLHLARDDSRVSRGGGVGPGGDRVDSIGTHVAKRHPGQVFTMWMLDFEGRDSQPFASLGNELRAGRGTLNAALADAGDSFFVPVAGPLAGRQRVAFIYGSTADVELEAQADALYFARRVTPLESP